MSTQNKKFNKINPNQHSIFLMLTIAFLLLVGGGLIMVPSVQADSTLVTDHMKVQAFAFDGSGTVGDPIISEATDVSGFSDTVTALDDLSSGRAARAEGLQNTTIDFETTALGIIEISGAAVADWEDADPGDERDPIGEATSEFTVTFDVNNQSTSFVLSGTIDTAADNTNASCTSITVTSPSGATFNVADPPGCGSSGQTIDETGTLAPGRYTFTIVAHAIAENPDATGGNAQASFGLTLALGCTIVGTSGDDFLVGTDGDDRICGLNGENTIDGRAGIDSIVGGSGTDLIHGGANSDFIYGEGGDDLLFGDDGDDNIFGRGGEDTISGGIGNDFITGGEEDDIVFGDDQDNCAQATSGPGLNDDEISGSGGNDKLFGCQGLDKLRGDSGDDLLSGDKENDVLLGGPGSDKLRGKKGNDTLTGDDPGAPGPRKDVLVGGGGNDTLMARDGVKDVVRGGGGNDQAQTDNNDTVTGVEVHLP